MGQLPPDFASIPGVFTANRALLTQALLGLPLAAAIGAALAFRPRRGGTPPRSAPVIQTQIVLAVIGAFVMVIVGSSVARAFGLVGAASLIRYRAKIDDPKDAAVALASLTLGLCTGVALYGLALFSLIFILGVLWILESLEGESRTTFELAVGAEDPSALQPKLERVLARYRIHYELRNTGAQELVYEAKLLRTTRTGRVSDAILALEGQRDHEIRWIEVPEVPKEQ